MTTQTAPDVFCDLRAFALRRIPAILADAGGRVGKDELESRIVDAEFRSSREDSEELDRDFGANDTWATDAFAWALNRLVAAGDVHAVGQDLHVRLRRIVDAPLADRCDGPAIDLKDEDLPRRARTTPSAQDAVISEVRRRAQKVVRAAGRAGIPFDRDFPRNSVREVERRGRKCALTDIPFESRRGRGGEAGRLYSPTPYRIEPEKGYTAGNVQWVLWAVSRGGDELSSNRFEEICAALSRKKRRR